MKLFFRRIRKRPYKFKVVCVYDSARGSIFTLFRIGRHYWRGCDFYPHIVFYFGKYKNDELAIIDFKNFLYPLIIGGVE